MSERLKSTNQYSNEEIIDDLTRDLKSSLSTEENHDEFVISPGSSSQDVPSSAGDSAGTKAEFTDIPLNTPKKSLDVDPDDLDAKEESDTDSINEVSLKDAEIDLTDDQKAERQAKAEELKTAGNEAFKAGEYEQSVEKYTEGLRICPLAFAHQRAILYCNRSAARIKMSMHNKAVKDCTRAIELDDKYLKAYLRRAICLENTEKFDESLADYKKVLELDPSNKEAQAAIVRLPPLIEAKNEKLKEEMLGKLKDLGNMILKPFGLSTANFQMEQDPETKGYKINFKQ